MSAFAKGRIVACAAFAAALLLSLFFIGLQPAHADGSNDLTAGSVNLSTQASSPSVSYRVHVQNDGWQGYKSNGAMAGTSGRSLRLEGINIRLEGAPTGSGITYRTHVQNDGWQGWKSNNEMAGTSGRSLRLEGIEIKLTGDIANSYDILYRVHVQNIGWQDWVKNGAMAGTSGRSLRLEAIEIRLVPKNTAPSISYSAHVQNVGWQSFVGAKATAGTEGKAYRVEAFKMRLNPGSYAGNVQNVGWQSFTSPEEIAGTTGRALRVEGIQIKLTGELADKYDVYYRAHVQNYGWLGWAKNGATVGSTGMSLRVEAFQVALVAKGGAAPGDTANPTANTVRRTLNGIDIASWQAGINVAATSADFVIVKATESTWYTNPYFTEHANATLAAGKKLGIYHFASTGNATAEADYFVDRVGPYIGRAALFLDWEASALAQGPGWAKTFLDRVYARTGVRPLIYMSQSVTNTYNWSSVAPTYGLWMARYLYKNMNTGFLGDPDGANGFSYWNSVKIYQYSSTGRIGGYGADLDLDIFYGTLDDWDAMARKG